MCSPTPNLTSNFETHKNVGDNFYFVYKYIFISSKYPQSSKKFKGHFWWPSVPSNIVGASNTERFLKFSKIVHKLLLRLITVDFWNQKFENSREYGNFENNVPQTPTWHQILKPIRMLVTIFISYTSIYIQILNTHKVWRILKDTFDYRPTRSHQTRPLASGLDVESLDPGGNL